MLDSPGQWLSAVQLQLTRARAASLDTVFWEIHCFANALRNLLRSVEESQDDPRVHDALVAFEEEIPDAKIVRDILEHWDEYTLAKGRLQKRGHLRHDAFLVAYASGETAGIAFPRQAYLHRESGSALLKFDPDDMVGLNLAKATEAAQRLVDRSFPSNGDGERQG
jgi:hypothetical protein